LVRRRERGFADGGSQALLGTERLTGRLAVDRADVEARTADDRCPSARLGYPKTQVSIEVIASEHPSSVAEDVDDFMEEAHDDYVGLWQVVGRSRSRQTTPESVRAEACTIVALLLERGLLAGNLTRDGGFVPWMQQEPDAVVRRIQREWDELGRDPSIDDTLGFTVRGESGGAGQTRGGNAGGRGAGAAVGGAWGAHDAPWMESGALRDSIGVGVAEDGLLMLI